MSHDRNLTYLNNNRIIYMEKKILQTLKPKRCMNNDLKKRIKHLLTTLEPEWTVTTAPKNNE